MFGALRSELGYKVEGLSGDPENEGFWPNWDRIKDYILALVGLPNNFDRLQREASELTGQARKAGDYQTAAAAKKIVDWSNTKNATSSDLREKLSDNLSLWQKKASEPTTNLGYIPLVLGAIGIAALAWVASEGMGMLKEYEQQKDLLSSLQDNVMFKNLPPEEQAKVLATGAGKTPPAEESFWDKFFKPATEGAKSTGMMVGLAIGAGILIYAFGKKR